jgi:hypothetical protein
MGNTSDTTAGNTAVNTTREKQILAYALRFLLSNIDETTADDLGAGADALELEVSALAAQYEFVGWKAAVNGAGNRPWFVMHHEDRRYHQDRRGNLVRYASHEAAERKAVELNRLQG